MNYFIYVIENKINNKMYIGQTIDIDRRRRGHFYPSSKCPYISNAIQKYGSENFDFCIIEKCVSLEQSNYQEMFWIETLGSLYPNGYNLREGGDAGGRPSRETIEKVRMANTGKKQSLEWVEKRAAAHRGRKNTPETIEKMRRAARNKPPEKCSMFGKRHSEQTKLKMRIAALQTHCKRGHPLHGPSADVRINSRGYSNCRRCNRFLRSGTVS